MQAHSASTAGDIDKSLDLLEELHKIPEIELPRSVLGITADQEMFCGMAPVSFTFVKRLREKRRI